MPRRPDREIVTLHSDEGTDASVLLSKCTQYELVTSLTAPSSFRVELGDEGTWEQLRPFIPIGKRMTVSINGQTRMKGRLLTRNLALSADAGGTVQLALRTRLADAMYTACDPKIGVKNTNLKDVVLLAFKAMGLEEADFIFEANVARELLTGRSSPGKVAPEIHTLREDEARVHPPETVYGFVDRHLSRFSLMMWDAPDGRIVIGAPDDEQTPVYMLTARRGPASVANNILSASKAEDYEEVPRDLWVYGAGGGRDQSKAVVKFVELETVLWAVTPPLDRMAVVIDESIKTQAQAEARARREMMRRSLMKDTWTIETDGFGHWDGGAVVQYLVDMVADVQIDIAGGASGPYLLYEARMVGNAESGHTTHLTAAGKGIWRL